MSIDDFNLLGADEALPKLIELGFDGKVVQRVLRLVDASEYKRRQAAPGVKITPRAFGRDRRNGGSGFKFGGVVRLASAFSGREGSGLVRDRSLCGGFHWDGEVEVGHYSGGFWSRGLRLAFSDPHKSLRAKRLKSFTLEPFRAIPPGKYCKAFLP